MFSVRVVYKDHLVTLKRNKKVDNLISGFIKECVRRVNGKTKDLPSKIIFHIFHDERQIGTMLWALSKSLDKPVLLLTRDDRKGNMYVYDAEGLLVKHSDL